MTVRRDQILDYVTYEEQRDAIRTKVWAAKAVRRFEVSEVLCFLFENDETVRYQILEMVRTERIVRESDIAREIETYNELLGRDGGLGCTLLIGLPDDGEREAKLKAWSDLPQHLFVELEDGELVAALHDGRQVSDGKLSSVQFLQFPVKDRVPKAIVCSLSPIAGRYEFSAEERSALADDLEAQREAPHRTADV